MLLYHLVDSLCIVIDCDTCNNNLCLTAIDSCFGGNDGMIDLTVNCGTAPFTYNWIGPGGSYNTEDISNIPYGTYCVVVNDANGCTDTLYHTIDCCDLDIINLEDSCSDCCWFKYELNASGYLAQNAFWSLTDLGGNGTSSYILYASPPIVGPVFIPGSGNISDTYTYVDSFLICTQNALEFNIYADPSNTGISQGNLGPSCMCFTTFKGWICDSLVVDVGNSPGMSLSSTISSGIVGSSKIGHLEAITTGGTPPFSYSWSGPNGFSESTKQISSSTDGVYCVIVTDNAGCTDTLCGSMNCNCNLCLTVVDSCDYIDLTVNCSTGPYSYLWSNGSTTEDIYNLSNSSYCVIVTDATGCSDTLCITIDCDTTCDINFLINEATSNPYIYPF